jgi:hypothetical protein
MFNFPPPASIQAYPYCRDAVLFTHTLAVEKCFNGSLFGLFHVNWSHMEAVLQYTVKKKPWGLSLPSFMGLLFLPTMY